jgi:hypothetical protein
MDSPRVALRRSLRDIIYVFVRAITRVLHIQHIQHIQHPRPHSHTTVCRHEDVLPSHRTITATLPRCPRHTFESFSNLQNPFGYAGEDASADLLPVMGRSLEGSQRVWRHTSSRMDTSRVRHCTRVSLQADRRGVVLMRGVSEGWQWTGS